MKKELILLALATCLFAGCASEQPKDAAPPSSGPKTVQLEEQDFQRMSSGLVESLISDPAVNEMLGKELLVLDVKVRDGGFSDAAHCIARRMALGLARSRRFRFHEVPGDIAAELPLEAITPDMAANLLLVLSFSQSSVGDDNASGFHYCAEAILRACRTGEVIFRDTREIRKLKCVR